MTLKKTSAPFTSDQVASINAYQQSDYFHEFTCSQDSSHPPLLTNADGLFCSQGDHFQNWVHAFMADWSWQKDVARIRETLATLRDNPQDLPPPPK